MTEKGVGARLVRKEDDRYMRGRGEFVADIKLHGLKDVAFLRSPVAHARILDIEVPEARRGAVFTAADMTGVRPIRAVSGLPGFKTSEQPPLASGKVRQVGEMIAVCVADTRAEAEDIAAEVFVDFDELPVVSDMLAAREAGAPLVHEAWGDNVYLETTVDADVEAVAATAAIRVTREFRTARQCMAPLEGRGVVAHWDARLEQLVVYSATQMPHIVRSGLSECLGLDHGQVRVVAPDVGGGFGYKGILLPEEVCLGWLAMNCGHPVRWIEDRREHLTASANCREHHYRITAYADASGRLLALDAEATVDAGAYSSYPFSACLEAVQVASILPGPYDFPVYRCKTYSVASNKPPILPYRGVARTGVCFAMELIIDAVAREAGREPHEVRLDNLVAAEAMPFDNVTGKHFDSGDYPECLRRAVAAVDVAAVRQRQRRGEADGRRVGVGFAIFCEQAAHGTSVYAGWGIPMVPGYEQAGARITPDGGLELRVGVHSHGQGLETTLAQVANEVLGIDPDKVKLVHGDTGLTPYSTGTWGSRCMVMAGGAVAAACRELAGRVVKIGARLLQTDAGEVRLEGGRVVAPGGSVGLADVANVWYLHPQDLPD
ncbi:MAG: xanthine dehydrogenase family protein molybdopterin-binding subunit, partial [Alphaproteobacteria bacterium]